MKELKNRGMNEFEFIETDLAEVIDGSLEFERSGEFEETPVEIVDKTEVIMCTPEFRIRGKISLVPGARLTDYLVDAHQFIAVTDVEVRDVHGKLILTTPFLDVNRDQLVFILPAELGKLNHTVGS
ncbi:hypothetical protein CSA56_00850 [candidate division KSB3 bacterium]|uniref:Uncharacterized protein n=1 Tax=candidate division KSB3 bacterium TaxID=2044937 RepID=A0A2G6KKS5_9BACT|nr:MAG: hypothetical protein CSA56_00850 [candidate division KSB3 bacterium]